MKLPTGIAPFSGSTVLQPSAPNIPVRILLDTDLGSDCDDAGALAVLHALADRGEAEITACIYSSGRNPYGAGAIPAINAYYGRAEIPIGAAAESLIGDPRNDFLEPIATDTIRYGHSLVRREQALDLVATYRRTLAQSPDHGVRIVSIGHLCGLNDLLISKPDQWSPLNGRELVRQKVEQWVAMGGEFPVEKKPGWNFGRNGSARCSGLVVEQWPTPVIFCGYEIGVPLVTGLTLHDSPPENPVRECYRLWGDAWTAGRASWDQAAVLCAVRGPHSYWDLRRGRCAIDVEGISHWHDDATGPHAYLVTKTPPAILTAEIETLMTQPPAQPRHRAK